MVSGGRGHTALPSSLALSQRSSLGFSSGKRSLWDVDPTGPLTPVPPTPGLRPGPAPPSWCSCTPSTSVPLLLILTGPAEQHPLSGLPPPCYRRLGHLHLSVLCDKWVHPAVPPTPKASCLCQNLAQVLAQGACYLIGSHIRKGPRSRVGSLSAQASAGMAQASGTRHTFSAAVSRPGAAGAVSSESQ